MPTAPLISVIFLGGYPVHDIWTGSVSGMGTGNLNTLPSVHRFMISVEHHHPDFVVIRASGTLTRSDYEAAVPELENAMSLIRGKPNLLVALEDFQGWDLAAFWKDLRFDLKHYNDFGRIAVIGESAIEKWLTRMSTPFTGAELRYFDRNRINEAEEWLSVRESGSGAAPSGN